MFWVFLAIGVWFLCSGCFVAGALWATRKTPDPDVVVLHLYGQDAIEVRGELLQQFRREQRRHLGLH